MTASQRYLTLLREAAEMAEADGEFDAAQMLRGVLAKHEVSRAAPTTGPYPSSALPSDGA